MNLGGMCIVHVSVEICKNQNQTLEGEKELERERGRGDWTGIGRASPRCGTWSGTTPSHKTTP